MYIVFAFLDFAKKQNIAIAVYVCERRLRSAAGQSTHDATALAPAYFPPGQPFLFRKVNIVSDDGNICVIPAKNHATQQVAIFKIQILHCIILYIYHYSEGPYVTK